MSCYFLASSSSVLLFSLSSVVIYVCCFQAMVDALLKKLEESVDVHLLLPCLCCVRILSRDLHGCEQLTSKTCMDLLVRHSGLEKYALTEGENLTIQDGDTLIMIEALKCLCNINLNSTHARAHCR